MTTQEWFHTVVTENSGGKSADILTTFGFGWIDVRDYAEIQALALEKEDAGGERIIISAGELFVGKGSQSLSDYCYRTLRVAGLE